MNDDTAFPRGYEAPPALLAGRVIPADRGEGFRPVVHADTPPEEAESGWGLRLVDKLADDWGVVAGHGSWVWFELRRRRDQAPAARSTRRSERTGIPGGSVDSSNRRSASSNRPRRLSDIPDCHTHNAEFGSSASPSSYNRSASSCSPVT